MHQGNASLQFFKKETISFINILIRKQKLKVQKDYT